MPKIQEIINEEVKTYLKESLGVMSIQAVADLISRMGYDYEIMLQMFQNAFREGGDEEVKNTFKDLTKGETEIDNVAKGQYVIK